MLAADHRVIRQMNTNASPASGLTPMLQGRTVDRTKMQMGGYAAGNKPALNEISEEKDDGEEKHKKAKTNFLNNLKGL